ncbi:MAG: hypothetical protein J6X18_08760 [Bacteroidales bacterium]|nr:hypothetical protein [Bacteroidales bacterium]
MTRINSAIPVRNLTDEHLLAEHREIKRLPYCLARAVSSGSIQNAPKSFTLGKGHVLFFLDKQSFIRKRYQLIHTECIRRGFKVSDFSGNWNSVPEDYNNDYEPTEEERRMIEERITDRLLNGKKEFYHYCGNRIDKREAAQLLVYPRLRPVGFGKK